jgi:uncharacterized protein (DUF2345 family)
MLAIWVFTAAQNVTLKSTKNTSEIIIDSGAGVSITASNCASINVNSITGSSNLSGKRDVTISSSTDRINLVAIVSTGNRIIMNGRSK